MLHLHLVLADGLLSLLACLYDCSLCNGPKTYSKNGFKKSFCDLNGVPGFFGAIEENVDVRCHELIVRVLHVPADKFDG